MSSLILTIITHIHVTVAQNYILQSNWQLTAGGSDNLCLFNYDTYLASIHSSIQLTEAISTSSSNLVYIGLNDIDTENTWEWTDGTMWDYGVTYFQSPWHPTQPNSAGSGEDCVVLSLGEWHDYPCTATFYSLCGFPASKEIVNDPSYYQRTITPDSTPFGVIDILDEIYISFDITFNSYPTEWGSILHFGNNGNERYPQIFMLKNDTFYCSFSVITNANPYKYVGVSLLLNTPYHFTLHQTQTHTTCIFNGVTMVDEDTDSHSIIMNRNMYLGDGYDQFDGIITNLYVTTSNSHSPNKFNYNCDATNRWEIVVGSWFVDDANCIISTTNETEVVAVAWLGNDTSSISWTDYKVEVKLNVTAGQQMGILLRAQSVSDINDQGSSYWIGYIATQGIQIGKFGAGMWTEIYMHYVPNNTLQYNVEYTLRVEAVGNIFDVYWENEFVYSFTDNDYSFGSIGLRTFHGKGTFSSVKITFPNDGVFYSVSPTLNPTDIPTSAPTTTQPTTSSPTTHNPTFVPTTSSPTTSVPTTNNPTFIPTTSVPTTNGPTTSVATTNNPTTVVPTSNSPITSAPITIAPTTSNPTISETTVSGTNTQRTTDGEEAVVETTTVTDGMVTTNNGEKEATNNLINDYIIYIVIAAVASITLLNCCIFILCCYLKKRNKDKGENAATNMNQMERVGSISMVNMVTNSDPPQTPQTPETPDMLLAVMSTAGGITAIDSNMTPVNINAGNDPQQIIQSMNNNNNISTMVLLSDPLPVDDDGDDDDNQDMYLKPKIKTNDGGTIGNDYGSDVNKTQGND